MADTVFQQQTANITVDDSYYVNRDDDEIGAALLHRRLGRFWALTPHEGRRVLNLVYRIAQLNPPATASMAIVGSGIGHIARSMIIRPWSRLDLFEINPIVVNFFNTEHPAVASRVTSVVTGDYQTTMTGLYNIIVYDISIDIPSDELPFLTAHLRPAGIILSGQRWTNGAR